MIKNVKLFKLEKKNDELHLIDEKTNEIIPSDKIGIICELLEHETTNEYWISHRYEDINDSHIDKILKNNGSCFIEMETYEGDYCGYRTPKLINDKVIIHL